MKNKNMLKEFKQREVNFKCWPKEQKRWLSPSEYIITANGQVCEVIGREIFKNISKEVILVQSVGLLDKNGKEIYEFDIVKIKSCGDEYIDVVKFYIDGDYQSCFGTGILGWHRDEIEVIGNIFENPNLLEK